MYNKLRLRLFLISLLYGAVQMIEIETSLHIIDDEGIVMMDEETQFRILDEKRIECNATNQTSIYVCPRKWDGVMCWPETRLTALRPNRSVIIDCADYVHLFIVKNKARKICFWTGTKAVWSKTYMNSCYVKKTNIKQTNWDEIGKLEQKMMEMRIFGYTVSLVALVISIYFILSKKRLRCPRNFVHVNLFVAFIVRISLIILSYEIIDGTNYRKSKQTTKKIVDDEVIKLTTVMCRISISLLRYTGGVYSCAIFSEALYLVLLLKFPFYSEQAGCKFCIILTWVLPLLWIIPWITVRLIDEATRESSCWHLKSPINFITKIPDTMLLLTNCLFAAYIIKTLYSKLDTKVNRENVIKYRKLAKSILMLIPIFGLHFAFFVWTSYANMKIETQVIFNYIESFFNAFQGLVVAIMCCFMQPDVRLELLLFICKILEKLHCCAKIKCFTCFKTENVQKIRQKYLKGRGQTSGFASEESLAKRSLSRANSFITASFDEHSICSDRLAHSPSYIATHFASLRESISIERQRMCFDLNFLFDKTRRNDFHQTHHHSHKNKSKVGLKSINTQADRVEHYHKAKHVTFATRSMKSINSVFKKSTVPLMETRLEAISDSSIITPVIFDIKPPSTIFDAVEKFIDDSDDSEDSNNYTFI